MNDRPAGLDATEARLREFLSAEVARARLDYPGLAPRPRPRSTRSFASLVALSAMVVMALVGAGLLASGSWSDRQGGGAVPSSSPAADGTLDVLLVRVEPPPGVFPAMGGHVAFVEIRPAGGGGLLHELRLDDENTTVQLAPGLYTTSTRVDVYGDVLLEGESEPPSYGEVARCPDVGFEVLSGLTTPLTVTVQEPEPTCSAVAGYPGESRPGPAPSQTSAPVPAGTAAACPAALIEGTLVDDERHGMALAGTDGVRRQILWPPGYTTQLDASGLVLYDEVGSIVAREGDFVSIGGGETASDGPWLACGDITVMDSGHQSLLRGLRDAGLDAHVGSRFNAAPFRGTGVTLCVTGESLHVYEFRTEAQAQAAVASIDPRDPSHVGDSIIEWVGNPRFWKGDRSIVLYAGSDPDTEDALDALLGEPFAVGGGRGDFPEERPC